MPWETGGISPLPREIMFTRKRGLLFLLFSKLIRFLNLKCALQRGNLHIAHLCTATISRAGWTLPVTSCSCRVPRPLWTAPSGRDSLPPAGFRTTRAAMTSPAHTQKHTSPSEGLSTRAHVLCSSVTCAVHSANRTHHAGHGRAEHMCSRGESLGLRGFFFLMRG